MNSTVWELLEWSGVLFNDFRMNPILFLVMLHFFREVLLESSIGWVFFISERGVVQGYLIFTIHGPKCPIV